MKYFLVFSTLAVWCSPVFSQQGDKPPVEYIESSSPLPGGGVVTSFINNGRQATKAGTTFRETTALAAVNPLPNSPAMQSVLTSNPAPVRRSGYIAAGPQAATANQTSAAATMMRVPNLGVANNWNRMQSFRVGCNGCQAGGVGSSAANLTGLPVAGASLPPTIGSTSYQPTIQNPQFSTTVNSVGGGLYQPIVQLQNMPPNAYAGQGIFGSPKLYVDGQPVRNLLRYLILP